MLRFSYLRETWLPFLEDGTLTGDERRQRIFVSIGTAVAAPLMFLFAFIEWHMDEPMMVALLMPAGVMMGAAYWLTRTLLYSSWIPRVLLAYVALMILVQIMLDRGQYTLFLPFLMPIMTIFVFGLVEGLVWSAITFLVLASLLMFPQAFGVPSLEQAMQDFVTTYLALVAFSAGYELLRLRAEERTTAETEKLRLERQRLLEAQQQLLVSEGRFRTYAEMASDWLFELDANFHVTYLSPNFLKTFGPIGEAILNTNALDLMRSDPGPEVEATVATLLEHKPIRDRSLRLTTSGGETRFALVRGDPIFDQAGEFSGYLGSGTDVTNVELTRRELRQKDRALHHAQKMEALGQLTSGVAHDFNNLLTVIVGNLEMLKLDFHGGQESEKVLAAELAVKKAADLTAQLLSFSRRQPLNPKPLDLGALLIGMEDMLRRTLGARIELQFFHEPDLWYCEADASQLESTILNLALNARDAITESGTLTITAKNSLIESHPAGTTEVMTPELPPGQYVEVSVSDDGTGIPNEMVDRIVEPFFTTKPSGEGTGLGLSMVYGFVTQSGGSLQISSEPGEGTRVAFWLPRAAAAASTVDTPAGQPMSEVRPLDILLVEDEPEVQRVLLRMMEVMGHNAMITDNAEAAIKLIEDRQPDLMISDIMLGKGINGVELADQVHEKFPDVAVLLITGYPKDALNDRDVNDFAPEIVTKPFSMRDLDSAIARVTAKPEIMRANA